MTENENKSSRFALCVKKDIREFLRRGKLTICAVFLSLFMIFLLLFSIMIPAMVSMVSRQLSLLSADLVNMIKFLADLFPDTLLESAAFFSTEIGVFYCVLVIALSFNVLPGEIKSGRLILPTCNGYTHKEIFLSKQLVYSAMSAVPAGLIYMIYCLIGSTFLYNNYPFSQIIVGTLAMTVNVFAIVAITVAFSVIYKHSALVIISMGITVAASPDLLYYMPFGKYIPTYIFTYLNYSESDPALLIIPVIEYAVIIVLLDWIIIRKGFSVIVDERR